MNMESEFMMKIGILTHYNVNNQGAQLQMYALYSKIKELGHEPFILTYVKNYDFDLEKKLRFNVSIKSIPYYIKNYLLKNGIGSVYRNYQKLKLNKQFRKKYFNFENYTATNIDMAIIGSDEVFSIPMGVNMMMYGHCVGTKNVVSYAPSFGQTDMKLLEVRNAKVLIQEGLKKFVTLSARDENTAYMIQALTGKDPVMVCDPAILYEFKEELNIGSKKIPNKKYMVIYAYDYNMTDDSEIRAIKEYAKKNNLLLVSPGTYHKWCDKNISCNALEWLNIIRHAECVVTDTFHGTITATIMNVPMAILIRDQLNSNKMTDLLKKLGIEDRRLEKITLKNIEEIYSKTINFDEINDNIKSLRKIGCDYLIEAINKCKG